MKIEEAQMMALAVRQADLSVMLRGVGDATVTEGLPNLTPDNLLVLIMRTQTVSEAEAGRLLATLVPFRPAPPPQPLAARRPELERTRIDLQQLPSKLRAAEITRAARDLAVDGTHTDERHAALGGRRADRGTVRASC